jgi:cytoskeletal protein CcmA (bactofilin family)
MHPAGNPDQVLCSQGGLMWVKRTDAPQPAKAEPRNLQTNQPLKPSPAALEGANQMNKDAVPPMGVAAVRTAARLGPSLQVKGEISGDEDLLIDGSVEGRVHLEGRNLTIGTTAKITADIVADEVVVGGNLKGNIRAKNRIEIKKDGSVIGDLTTAQIMIEDGAYFKGSIEIERSAEKPAGNAAFSQTEPH